MFRPTQSEPLIRTLGAALWLRADQGVLNDNRWVNQAEPGLILHPVGDPTFDPTGFNGRQTFLFDGTQDAFEVSEPFGTSLLTECTFVVAAEHDVDVAEALFSIDDGTSANMLRIRVNPNGVIHFVTSSGGTLESDTSTPGMFPVGTPIIMSCRWDGSLVTYRVQGGATVDTDTHTQPIGIVDRTQVGDSNTVAEWDGAISEVVYFNANIGAAMVAEVENDVNSRWGVF